MVLVVRKMHPDARERFVELVSMLKTCRTRLEGGTRGNSQYDRLELQPGYAQLQHHVDHALRWAEEMQWIIEQELTPA